MKKNDDGTRWRPRDLLVTSVIMIQEEKRKKKKEKKRWKRERVERARGGRVEGERWGEWIVC